MHNLLTDIAGLRVGQADDAALISGVTAVLFDRPAIAAVSTLGGAPASRETALLELENAVDRIDAVVLSGGSTYGLDATTGVQAALREAWALRPREGLMVPIVVQASLFDLTNGGDKTWGRYSPYAELGYRAAREASEDPFALGTAGAGTGATTATLRGGIGSASATTSHGHRVAALVATNAVGTPLIGDGPHFWAAPFEIGDEFGGLGFPPTLTADTTSLRVKTPDAWGTVIGLVVTDAALTPQQTKRLAILGQDGVARAVLPAHLARDGDTIFAASTAAQPLSSDRDAFSELCLAATAVTARAVARGVYAASPSEHGPPAWSQRFANPAMPR